MSSRYTSNRVSSLPSCSSASTSMNLSLRTNLPARSFHATTAKAAMTASVHATIFAQVAHGIRSSFKPRASQLESTIEKRHAAATTTSASTSRGRLVVLVCLNLDFGAFRRSALWTSWLISRHSSSRRRDPSRTPSGSCSVIPLSKWARLT